MITIFEICKTKATPAFILLRSVLGRIAFLIFTLIEYYCISIPFIAFIPFLFLFWNGADNYKGILLATGVLALTSCAITLTSFRRERSQFSRVSKFFIAYKIPLFKVSVISQCADRSELQDMSCSKTFKSFAESLSAKESPELDLKTNWTYFTVTHQPIIDRLRDNGIEDMHLWTCFKQSLKSTQKKLLNNRCKECPDTKNSRCQFYNFGTEVHQFYFVKFHTPATF